MKTFFKNLGKFLLGVLAILAFLAIGYVIAFALGGAVSLALYPFTWLGYGLFTAWLLMFVAIGSAVAIFQAAR